MACNEKQEPPFCIQVEACEGCNLRCAFCGIQGIKPVGPVGDRSGPYNFMTVETATMLAKQMAEAQWNSRLEFAMHGEPTKNPDLVKIVSTFRSYLPKASMMLTTNAVPLIEVSGPDGIVGEIADLFGAGFNTIAIDDYRPHRVAPHLRERSERLAELGIVFGDYPKDGPKFNPHPRRKASDPPLLSIVEDISEATEGTHSHLNNHAGCAAPPLDEPLAKMCTKPFREFSVRWDGSVAICCNDWRGEYKVGNVNTTHCETLWQSAPFRSARRLLYAKDRDFGVCRGCDDFGGFRPGLVLNGRRPLPEPTDDDRRVAAEAMEGPSYTAPNPRKWEGQITLSRKATGERIA